MRKALLVAAFALPMAAAPAAAADLKAYIDCVAFVTHWCKAAQDEAAWWERIAVDVHCMGLYSNCASRLIDVSIT